MRMPERPEIALHVNDAQGRRQSPETMARIILTYLEVRTPVVAAVATVSPWPRSQQFIHA